MKGNLAHTQFGNSINILDYNPLDKISHSIDWRYSRNRAFCASSMQLFYLLKKEQFILPEDIMPLSVQRKEESILRIVYQSEKQGTATSETQSIEIGNALKAVASNIAVSIDKSIEQVYTQMEIIEEKENRLKAIKNATQCASTIFSCGQVVCEKIKNSNTEKYIGGGSRCSSNQVMTTKEIIPHFFHSYRKQQRELYTKVTSTISEFVENESFNTVNLDTMPDSSFLAWLKKKNTSLRESKAPQPEKVEKNTTSTPVSPPLTEKQAKKEDTQELLTDQPAASNITKKVSKKKTKKKRKKKALDAKKLNEDIVSETLAELLAYHGHKERAIEMYHKLSLLNPKKSSYFASQVKKLNEKE